MKVIPQPDDGGDEPPPLPPKVCFLCQLVCVHALVIGNQDIKELNKQTMTAMTLAKGQ